MQDHVGRIQTPSPRVQVGKRVVASEGSLNVEAAVDGRYRAGTPAILGTPSEQQPVWLAIEVGVEAEALLLVWSDGAFGPFNQVSGGSPASYTIETSFDSTDGQDGTWETVVTVTKNPVRSRGHSFDFSEKSWVRLTVTSVGEGSTAVRLDEVALHDITEASGERPMDTWFFMGDSLTQAAFARDLSMNDFDALVHAVYDPHYPAVVGAGIGGELSGQGADHVSEWLELAPDFEHVAILYGTNDAWGNRDPASVRFEDNLTTIVEAVLEAGRLPVLARIPYATAAHGTVPRFNAIIQDLTERFELPCGPDFYSWYLEHPEELQEDGVHLTRAGVASMNRLWFEAASALYPQ